MQSSSERTIITKANGEREFFEPQKLYQSLVNSGADDTVAEKVTSTIASSLKEGNKTKDIYRKAFDMLQQVKRPVAARYSVKRALLDLGPSGYPFETFLGEIYSSLGYTTNTQVMVRGRCVEHELDMVAVKGDERIGAEVKFHNKPGTRSDLKVALYVYARFEDIEAQSGRNSETDYTDRLLITNTKFTKQVEVYAACVGLQLISWNYPAKGNLQELIEITGVHPVSCLTTLSEANKQYLMERDIVLCRQIKHNPDSVAPLGLSNHELAKLHEEIADLCK
jgi:hypothetical protein